MTTMAALLGGLPLMLGHGAGSELRQPLGYAMVGGLALSQMLTLFTTPVVYLYLDRLQSWLRPKAAEEPRDELRLLRNSIKISEARANSASRELSPQASANRATAGTSAPMVRTGRSYCSPILKQRPRALTHKRDFYAGGLMILFGLWSPCMDRATGLARSCTWGRDSSRPCSASS